MKHRYLALVFAPLLLLSQQLPTSAQTPTASIANISPSKLGVRPAGALKVTWNFSSTNLTLDQAKKMEVILTPASGAPCQPRCPYGIGKFISGYISGGLWEAYIDIPANVLQTDYEITVSLADITSAKSLSAVFISNDPPPADIFFAVPTITGTGWVPSIGPITRTADGFTFKILNFNSNYTWSYGTGYGNSGVSADGVFTVTGLRPGIPTEVAISSKSATGLVTVARFTGRSALKAPYPLDYKITKQYKDGFDFSIPNVDGDFKYTYRIETTVGRLTASSYSNFGGAYSVREIPESTTASVDVFITSNSNEDGYGRVIGSSLPKPAPVIVPTPTPTVSATPTPTPTPTPTVSATPTPSVTATPSPTTKAKKTITCVKGKATKKVTNSNPKCPKGYKKKAIS